MNNATMGILQEAMDVQRIVRLKQIRIVMGPSMDVLYVEMVRLIFLSNVMTEILLITMDAQALVNMKSILFV